MNKRKEKYRRKAIKRLTIKDEKLGKKMLKYKQKKRRKNYLDN